MAIKVKLEIYCQYCQKWQSENFCECETKETLSTDSKMGKKTIQNPRGTRRRPKSGTEHALDYKTGRI